jgi:hypothetical protein
MKFKFYLFLIFLLLSPLSLLKAQDLPKILISEVYYNPNPSHGATGTLEWQNEWIELFNFGEKEIDISGWKIFDNSLKQIEIPKSPPIPPKGFAIITPSSSTFQFWPDLPQNTVKIVLGSKIGNGLSNEKDSITLIDTQGNVIDLLSWDKHSTDPKITCKIPSKDGVSLEKKPFFFEQNASLCSHFNQENPNPGRETLSFYWHKEIKDPKDSLSGYEILSAKIVIGEDEILKFLPPPPFGGLCKTLIA